MIAMQLIGTAKRMLKEHRSSRNLIIRLGVSCFYVLWNAAQTTRKMFVDSNFRSIFLLRLLNSKNVHQTTSLTCINRYPTIFLACQEYFNGKEDLKILSYGCSTGEEVLTLRQFFPNAQIIGTDINKRSLELCKKLPVDDNITFIYSSPREIEKHGPYDAIFCMPVLQRNPHEVAAKGISNLKKIYSFEKFETQIMALDKLLNQKGLLIVHYTQYSLCDTRVASKYGVLGDYNQNDYLSPVFDKNSNLVKNPPSQNSIFIKSQK
ncbi:class I SAM-dependent methyltransferase [Neobacillus vireti]|uniref:class I SAM-dependent methyltransferase n=1 Tax=Neobacillus vireti TaxID=220686 RepID=UPI002FFE1F47